MSERLDALIARKKGEKAYYTKIGAAFRNAKGYSLVLDALPIPDNEGQVKILLLEPMERSATDGIQRVSGVVAETAKGLSVGHALNGKEIPF